MDRYDAIVVGGGAAGLSTALVLARARRRVVVVDAGEPRNSAAAHMHGYLSRDGLPPSDLLAAGRAEVASYGGHVMNGTVSTVSGSASSGFEVTVVEEGRQLTARRLVLATGLHDELPDVLGLWPRWGRDVLHCPYCHGYEVRDRPIGVLGGLAGSVAHALLLSQWSDDVVFFTHTDDLTDVQSEQLVARGIAVVDGLVTRVVVEDDQLLGLELANASVVARAAVFVRPRVVPNVDLLVGLGCAFDAEGWVKTDRTGATSIAGIWVVGNASNPRAQVITAAGEGSAAAIAVNSDLVEEDVRHSVLRHREDRDRATSR